MSPNTSFPESGTLRAYLALARVSEPDGIRPSSSATAVEHHRQVGRPHSRPARQRHRGEVRRFLSSTRDQNGPLTTRPRTRSRAAARISRARLWRTRPSTRPSISPSRRRVFPDPACQAHGGARLFRAASFEPMRRSGAGPEGPQICPHHNAGWCRGRGRIVGRSSRIFRGAYSISTISTTYNITANP